MTKKLAVLAVFLLTLLTGITSASATDAYLVHNATWRVIGTKVCASYTSGTTTMYACVSTNYQNAYYDNGGGSHTSYTQLGSDPSVSCRVSNVIVACAGVSLHSHIEYSHYVYPGPGPTHYVGQDHILTCGSYGPSACPAGTFRNPGTTGVPHYYDVTMAAYDSTPTCWPYTALLTSVTIRYGTIAWTPANQTTSTAFQICDDPSKL